MRNAAANTRLTSLSVASVARMLAAIYFVLGAFASAVTAAGVLLATGPVTQVALAGPVTLSFDSMPPVYVFIGYPILSALGGGLLGALIAWLYNVFARRIGPIRLKLD